MKHRLETKRIVLYLVILGLAVFTLLSLYPREPGDSSTYRDPEQLRQLVEEQSTPHLLLDVRTPAEYTSGHIPTARNLPLQIIAENLPAAPRDSLIILYCRSGNRSAQAKRILENEGYTNIVDFGGINRWPWELSH
jgi:rhodanese-related sulfurtransferase